MTETNSSMLALARTYWDREMANDIDGVMDCFAEDATLVLPDLSVLDTPDKIRDFYTAAAAAFPRRSVEIVNHFGDGRSRCAFVWEAVLYDGNNCAFNLAGINVVTVRDGQFLHLRAGYPEPAPA